MQMRVQDNSLAHQLLEVRRKMNLLKMEEEHACMIDDITWELEEEEEETSAMTRLYEGSLLDLINKNLNIYKDFKYTIHVNSITRAIIKHLVYVCLTFN